MIDIGGIAQRLGVYGPEKAIFDKSWKLPDIEMVS
jgi:hypothetical protein